MTSRLPDWIDRRKLGAELRRTRGDEVLCVNRWQADYVTMTRVRIAAFGESDRRRLEDQRARGLERLVWFVDRSADRSSGSGLLGAVERLRGLLLVCTPPGESP